MQCSNARDKYFVAVFFVVDNLNFILSFYTKHRKGSIFYFDMETPFHFQLVHEIE